MKWWASGVVWCLASAAALAAGAERHDATLAIPVALGQSVVPLNGPWTFHTGDDAKWADPAFDDSGWETVDLTPAAGAHDSDVGMTGYVPGWTAKGHAGYWGYGWYRTHLSVHPFRERLALSAPFDVDEAYQLFCNGELLGGIGDFSRRRPEAYSAQPRIFPLPAAATAVVPTRMVIAIRVWMGRAAIGAAPDVGGIHIAPAVGTLEGVQARYQLQWPRTSFCTFPCSLRGRSRGRTGSARAATRGFLAPQACSPWPTKVAIY